jgi:hypothetical protein
VWARKVAIDLQAGFGTPYGLLGASVEWTPVRFLTIATGVGGSFGGAQLALLPRLRLLDGRTAVSIGGGPSWGGYATTDDILYPSWKATYPCFWLNGDLSIEHRSSSGLDVRGYVGAATVVYADSASECWAEGYSGCPSAQSQRGKTIPYLGLAIGYAFPSR